MPSEYLESLDMIRGLLREASWSAGKIILSSKTILAVIPGWLREEDVIPGDYLKRVEPHMESIESYTKQVISSLVKAEELASKIGEASLVYEIRRLLDIYLIVSKLIEDLMEKLKHDSVNVKELRRNLVEVVKESELLLKNIKTVDMIVEKLEREELRAQAVGNRHI